MVGYIDDGKYGKIGELTQFKYEDGTPMHVGDVVCIVDGNGREVESIVVKRQNSNFVMGIQACCRSNGNIDTMYKVELKTKYNKKCGYCKIHGLKAEYLGHGEYEEIE